MSLQPQQNVPLAPLTTLKVGGEAEFFVTAHSEAELCEAVAWAKGHNMPLWALGGGSNVLIADEGVQGVTLHIALKGMSHVQEGETVLFTVQAGELLDDAVSHAVAQGWWGLENLSHIPGTVGATPIQNVGAYGVELKDVVHEVRAYNTDTLEFEVFNNASCIFSYRDSFFKTEAGKKYIITEVTFALSSVANPQVSYRDLALRFKDAKPTLEAIRTAVIEIRAGKFPDWHEVGTAGSFFKNPFVTKEKYAQLCEEYPDLPGFPTDEGMIKVSLGWILDKALALRGYRKGNVATYENQALVLIAEKNATAREIEEFANEIVATIKNKIGVVVAWEVTKIK